MDLNYKWTLKDAIFTKDKGKVLSCFSCGGGSTMGYKLAGFDVIGAVDVDPKMMEVYRENHKPKYSYVESIVDFKNRDDLPQEFYDLDILDGSPPCSSFSMSGNRHKDWGKEKKFTEGQSKQVLDTLFFDFIDLAKKLKPKVVVAENVKGILQGKAKAYVSKIIDSFDEAGYFCQTFLLDSSDMGVPQKRERAFFVAIRKDLASPFMQQIDMFLSRPHISLNFNCEKIPFSEIREENGNQSRYLKSDSKIFYWWHRVKEGEIFSKRHPKKSYFNEIKLHRDKPINTLRATNSPYDYKVPRKLFDSEMIKAGSFPSDYNFFGYRVNYIIGMSVPPLMTARLANEIYKQWISKL